MKTTNEELVEEMVRDFTKIQPRSKSEVRERINNLLAAKDAAWEERVIEVLENNRNETLWGDEASNEVMWESINAFIIAVKDELLTPPLPDQGEKN